MPCYIHYTPVTDYCMDGNSKMNLKEDLEDCQKILVEKEKILKDNEISLATVASEDASKTSQALLHVIPVILDLDLSDKFVNVGNSMSMVFIARSYSSSCKTVSA